MGKLRDNLTALSTLLAAVNTRMEQVEQESIKLNTNLNKLFDGQVKSGVELLYVHLSEKFKARKDSYDKHLKDTIVQHKDADVVKYLTGIAQGLVAVKKHQAVWDAFAAKDVKALAGDLVRLKEQVAVVQAMIDKKRKRFLQSAKYKAKINGYEATLNDIVASLKPLKEFLQFCSPSVRKVYTDKIKLGLDTTLGDLDKDSMLMDLKREVADSQKALQSGARSMRKYREEGNLSDMMVTMKKWAQEADDMEAEAEGSEEDDPKPKLGAITFKIGSSVVATAKAGEYDTKAKQLVADLTWKIKGDDPLSYLQKKFKVEADYAKGDGKLAQEMKLEKLLGNLVKATFKG